MRVAIMQPYLLPYLGYFQLAGAVDVFVVYDNIKYTKKGWINRNRMLLNGSDAVFSLPLKQGSDALDVRDRVLAEDFDGESLLARFRGAYGRAPRFAETFPLLERIFRCDDVNLFRFLHHSLLELHAELGLASEIRISSQIPTDPELRGQDRVLALCEALGADTYINLPGGVGLYSCDVFRSRGVELKFLHPRLVDYVQFGGAFVPWLSIVDVMMFNPPETVRSWVAAGFDLE